MTTETAPQLQAVPRSWQLVPLHSAVTVVGGATPSKDRPELWEGIIPWVSPKDMKVPVISDTEDHVSEAALAASPLKIIEPPAVLLVIRGMILAHTAPVALTAAPVTLNQDMKALRPRAGLHAAFLAYQLRALSPTLLSLVEEAGHGTRCLRTDLWRKLVIAVPPVPQQQAIAGFLDRKTAAIDGLISTKEQLRERLEELLQARTTWLVTRGPSSGVKTKAPGIPWLGPSVPAHWKVIRLRHLVAQQVAGPYGSSLTKDMYTDSGFRVYGQQQVIPNDFAAGDYFISPEKFAEMRQYEVHPGDLLVTVMGTIGKAAVVPANIERGIINPRLVRYVLRPSTSLPEFVAWVLRSHVGVAQLTAMAKGTTMDGLNLGLLGDLYVPVPPLAEQKNIVTAVSRLHAQVGAAIDRLSRQVEMLREYRQALITAAVTGQLDLASQEAA